jgi:chromosome segregation ATPase
MTIAELQTEYDSAGAAIAELKAELAAAERDAAEAKAEAGEVTDGQGVLTAMAEERAALNRAAIARRNLAATHRRRESLSIQLMKAQEDATKQVIKEALNEAAAALVDVYQDTVAARDAVYLAQRETGAYPVDSPLDRVCSALENAIGAAGGQVTPDSSRSVTVRYGDFQYTRRPIGYVAPTPAPRRERRPLLAAMQESIAALNRYNRQYAHEFEE